MSQLRYYIGRFVRIADIVAFIALTMVFLSLQSCNHHKTPQPMPAIAQGGFR